MKDDASSAADEVGRKDCADDGEQANDDGDEELVEFIGKAINLIFKAINFVLKTVKTSVSLHLCLREILHGGFDTGYSLVEIGVFC